MNHGKSIELFLVNGTADSIITAELSNWNGKAIKIPRTEVKDCKREDITGVGVYFLFCKNEEDGKDSVYIGEAENVEQRLKIHLSDYQQGKEKYYWTTAVVFVGAALNKALIRYLENRICDMAAKCNRYQVLTKNTYKNTVVKESEAAAMEEFLDNIRILINTLGYKVLEPLPSKQMIRKDDTLFLETQHAKAAGVFTEDGFVVFKEARVSASMAAKMPMKLRCLREKCEANGTIRDGILQEDMLFSSPSAAAAFILGYSASGPLYWKNRAGVALREIE